MHTLQQLQSGQLKGAKSLKLSEGLREFPQEILELAETLEVLDLSGNHLKALPPDFARLQKLRIAFFSNNDFTVFPVVLAQCPHLQMIGFKACRLQQVPEGALPESTRWLILTDNQLTALPASIGNCSRLQKLMLAGNKLQEFPAELARCQNLELLRISANELIHLPDWLFNLPRLAWLAFSGNPFSFQSTEAKNRMFEIPFPQLQLEEVLGEGASGIISKALWQKPEAEAVPEEVAVKIFKGEVTSDGLPQDEMQACLAAGEHPNLVRVLGKLSQHPAQRQGLVFHLIPAGYRNLGGPPSFATCTRDTFPDGTTFPLPEIQSIGGAAASAVAHLHARGITHGDLYAHNTLVNGDGHALLSDFGAATLYDRTDNSKAFAIEKLEVRAFGCLLQDLLERLAPTPEMQQKKVLELRLLMEDCLQPQVALRPSFEEIEDRLGEIG